MREERDRKFKEVMEMQEKELRAWKGGDYGEAEAGA